MKIIPSSRKNRYIAGVIILLAAIALIVWLVSWLSAPPSEIWTWYDLDAVRNNMAGNYTLMNDLDSTTAGYEELASPTANEGKGWVPMGTIGEWGDQLTGTLDGQGYEIHDLYINRPGEYDVGLFGAVGREGVVKNIGLVNVTVNGYSSVGGLVGFNNVNGAVSNSYSIGSVTGSWNVGGLVGTNALKAAVSNSYSTGSVTGNNRVGGLVGFNERGTVNNSYSTSSVTGDEWIGGLVGENRGGTVSNSFSTGSVTGDEDVGGLVGWNEEGTVSDSFWDTETSGQSTSAGGTGKTTAEMQDIATFSGVGWNITAVADPATPNPAYIWNIPTTPPGYPFLSWQSV